jgi:6-phosphogluconolactonase/glucosamine-6-phosphate isomerase/deaminase
VVCALPLFTVFYRFWEQHFREHNHADHCKGNVDFQENEAHGVANDSDRIGSVGIHEENVRSITNPWQNQIESSFLQGDVEQEDIQDIATEYSNLLRAGDEGVPHYISKYEKDGKPRFDVVILGVGADGSCAGFHPTSAALLEHTATCVPVPDAPGGPRVSLTVPILSNAKHVCFVATGEDKAEVLGRLIPVGDDCSKQPPGLVAAVYGWEAVDTYFAAQGGFGGAVAAAATLKGGTAALVAPDGAGENGERKEEGAGEVKGEDQKEAGKGEGDGDGKVAGGDEATVAQTAEQAEPAKTGEPGEPGAGDKGEGEGGGGDEDRKKEEEGKEVKEKEEDAAAGATGTTTEEGSPSGVSATEASAKEGDGGEGKGGGGDEGEAKANALVRSKVDFKDMPKTAKAADASSVSSEAPPRGRADFNMGVADIPAAWIYPANGDVHWFIDKAAGKNLPNFKVLMFLSGLGVNVLRLGVGRRSGMKRTGNIVTWITHSLNFARPTPSTTLNAPLLISSPTPPPSTPLPLYPRLPLCPPLPASS